MRKSAFVYAKTKMQISFAVTAQLISDFVYAAMIVHSLRNLKPLTNFCGHTARFVSDLVGNPEYRFSCDAERLLSIFFCR